MPIYKYRSLEKAEKHLEKLLPADPITRLRRLEIFLVGLRQKKPAQRGLFKFKTLEAANEHRRKTTG